jgi:hypothetical protein
MQCACGALKKDVERDERDREDAERECARGRRSDAGELEDDELNRRPDGQSDSGVEVAGPVPVTCEVVADGRVTIPALVGVFGPVHPGGVVGEVGRQVQEMEREEDGRDAEEQDGEEKHTPGLAGGGGRRPNRNRRSGLGRCRHRVRRQSEHSRVEERRYFTIQSAL